MISHKLTPITLIAAVLIIVFAPAMTSDPETRIHICNTLASTRLLSPAGGHHLFTLPWAQGMGISIYNVVTIAGLLIAITGVLAMMRQPPPPDSAIDPRT